MNSEMAWWKFINQSKNKYCGYLKKLLISTLIITKQWWKSNKINYQVDSYKLLLNKSPLGWYWFNKTKYVTSKYTYQ